MWKADVSLEVQKWVMWKLRINTNVRSTINIYHVIFYSWQNFGIKLFLEVYGTLKKKTFDLVIVIRCCIQNKSCTKKRLKIKKKKIWRRFLLMSVQNGRLLRSQYLHRVELHVCHEEFRTRIDNCTWCLCVGRVDQKWVCLHDNTEFEIKHAHFSCMLSAQVTSPHRTRKCLFWLEIS